MDQLSPIFCGSLPAADVFTGCDTKCSINSIGKKTSYSKLVINIDSFADLTTLHENDGNVAQVFALLLYGKKGIDIKTLDEMRYLMATCVQRASPTC